MSDMCCAYGFIQKCIKSNEILYQTISVAPEVDSEIKQAPEQTNKMIEDGEIVEESDDEIPISINENSTSEVINLSDNSKSAASYGYDISGFRFLLQSNVNKTADSSCIDIDSTCDKDTTLTISKRQWELLDDGTVNRPRNKREELIKKRNKFINEIIMNIENTSNPGMFALYL